MNSAGEPSFCARYFTAIALGYAAELEAGSMKRHGRAEAERPVVFAGGGVIAGGAAVILAALYFHGDPMDKFWAAYRFSDTLSIETSASRSFDV